MITTEPQTPEQMLERWQGYECKCDLSVGHLCEVCHDIIVIRNLIKERDKLKLELEKYHIPSPD